MFPIEILEIFFKYSHGTDIINFRYVCKTWNNVITRLSRDTNMWQNKCQNEISIHLRRSIAQKLYPNISWTDFHESKDNLKWLSMYRTWMKWHKINEFNVSTAQFEPFFIRLPLVQITCLAVSESLLAVGSSEGFIAFYDIERSIVEPIFIADQMEHVSNVQFLRDDKRIAAISASNMYRVMLWDILLKKVISTPRYGRLISTTHGCVLITMKNKLIIRNKCTERSYDFLELYGTIVALVADGEEAFLWTDLGYNYKVSLNETPYMEEEYVEPPADRVLKYYVFRPWTAMCITMNGFLGISVNSQPWVMYEILSKLHGTPTALLFYADVLVLGLDSGSVHMYYVNNAELLTTWDFCPKNSKSIVVANQAIIALDIMDRLNKQYLIAATTEKINIVQLYDPS
ncbi:uncharacterized protein LOC124308243 isoform X1 [Neodiprion virginianus]|uniref:uncharacterized protein LOC124185856 isoform X1 n=1 Tax=Neodiprion fabricii TaxID=2872261 RepID=UPI001ED91FC4|nr:uncharacterized protein LOC124185856 isoform X1 [Neodiprion fabricii]XP_046626743.1 uncharacterized protein LOC124308243 isoform X1 [Neodiprion virginianus]